MIKENIETVYGLMKAVNIVYKTALNVQETAKGGHI